MQPKTNIIIIISIIAVIPQFYCAPHYSSHPHCQHQYNSHRYPLHTSQWEQELSEKFSPIIDDYDSQIHMHQLQDKMKNLFGIIEDMKDGFTYDTLNKPYNQIDKEESGKGYPQLDFGEDDIPSAYSLFQKLHIASEIVFIDLMHMDVRKANANHLFLWKRIYDYSLSILKRLHIEMEYQKQSISLLPRSELPDTIRCVEHSIRRDERNFYILRHFLEASRKLKNATWL